MFTQKNILSFFFSVQQQFLVKTSGIPEQAALLLDRIR